MTENQDESVSLYHAMTRAMASATADAEPDINTLIIGGLSRARRRRSRRRTAWAVTSSAVAAGVLFVVVTSGGDGPFGARPVPGPGKGHRTGPADPASVAGVYDRLKALLPQAATLSPGMFEDIDEIVPQHSLGSLGGITVSYAFLYDDGHGVTTLVLNVDYAGVADYQKSVDDGWRKLGDGSVAKVTQQENGGAGNSGAASTSVKVIRPDGTTVELDEIAADTTKPSGVTPTRTDLPLSVDQMLALAGAQTWAPLGPEIRDSVPQRLAPSGATALPTVPSDAHRPKPADLAVVLTSLLPPALRPSGTLNTPYGDGQVLVDDGHGVARLSVRNGEPDEAPYKCGTAPIPNQDQCQDKQLADGTIVQLTHRPLPQGDSNAFGAGVQEWRAVAVRPSGEVTVLVEVNSTDPRVKATRPDAPVSLDQLGALAANPAWDRFAGENPPSLYPNPTPGVGSAPRTP